VDLELIAAAAEGLDICRDDPSCSLASRWRAVMVTIEYHVDSKDRAAFLVAVDLLSHERKRDGAYAWCVFQDTAKESVFLETFFLESWLEHLRQHERVTKADRLLENNVRRFVSAPPKITHYVATGRP
jgi:hypothetical protein